MKEEQGINFLPFIPMPTNFYNDATAIHVPLHAKPVAIIRRFVMMNFVEWFK